MIIRQFLTSFLCLGMTLSIQQTLAQSGGIKFGKIDKQYLEMKTYDKDTSAAAVILADYGSASFRYNTTKEDFQITYKRHRRIKILKKGGYEWANHNILLYHNLSSKESISQVKGMTYNLVNGKIVKHKLEKSGIFREKSSEHHDIKKLTMPNVKEGSVIEYSYTVISDFPRNLDAWQFQYSIPTIWSENKVSIPEYFIYQELHQGYLDLPIHKKSIVAASINIPYRSASGKSENNTINYVDNVTRMAMGDVPAIKGEEYITNLNNYVSKIEFQLASTKYPKSALTPHLGTWESVRTKLMENSSFGQQLNRKAFLKPHATTIASQYNTPAEQAFAARQLIANKIEWDGKTSIWVQNSIRKAFEEGTGNCADINMALVVLLRNLNIEANPVILSTRNHRIVHPVYPILTRFNYVVAQVKIDGKDILLDATDNMLPFGHIPYRCMNGQGRILGKTENRWVELRGHEKYSNYTQITLSLNEDNTFGGKVVSSCKGYSASGLRKKILSQGEDAYVEKQIEDNESIQISDYEIKNLKSIGQSLEESFEIELSDYALNSGHIIYLNPLLGYATDNNPFSVESRLYPVDYGCPVAESIVVNFTIPDGYSVDEMPKNTMIKLPNNGGSFRYVISVLGDKLSLVSSINIKQTLFLPNEYASIKQFYDLIVAKHAEQIVLKKNT